MASTAKTTASSAAKMTASSAAKTTASPAGYSGTPLPKKLGWKDGGRMVLVNAPKGIEAELTPHPAGGTLAAKAGKAEILMLLFCPDRTALTKSLPLASKSLAAEGSLWISWPKKTSKLFVDLTEDVIREVALPTGLVDVKVCAINGDWSGLKLMVRKELRRTWNKQ